MFQGPFSIIAALPAANWLSTSAWVHSTTLLDAEPSWTMLVRSCRAWAVCGVSMFFSLPPLVHIHGMNCHVPS